MKNKILLIPILLFFFVSLISSAPTPKTIIANSDLTISPNLVHYVPLNTSREWEIHLVNTTRQITSAATCGIHIYNEYSDGGHAYLNSSSTFSNTYDIEMITPAAVHNKKGEYSIKVFCNTSNEAGLYESTYYVTKSGNPPADDIFTTFIYALFIFGSLGLFYTLFLGFAKLATGSETIYDVLVSWCFFILMLIINYLGQEFLIRTYVEDLSALFISISIWTNGLLPVISFIISVIWRSLKKKKNLSVQELAGRNLY